jgi:hypothetical protein
MWRSPTPRRPFTHSRQRARTRVSTWDGSPSPRWRMGDKSSFPLLPQSRSPSAPLPTPRRSTAEREPPPQESGGPAGQSPPACRASASRVSGAASITKRRASWRQPTTRFIMRTCGWPTWSGGAISPNRQRRGVERLSGHPHLQERTGSAAQSGGRSSPRSQRGAQSPPAGGKSRVDQEKAVRRQHSGLPHA